MSSLSVGDRVPDLTFLRPDGNAVRLAAFPGPLLLVYLRHLRCISCLGHVAEVREHFDEIRRAGADVLVVTQSLPKALSGVSLPLPTVCDPDRTSYRLFGLDRGRVAMFFRPRVLRRYMRLIFSGWFPHPGEPGEDMLQLGGDFILSADRRLLYAHRSNDPADRPSAADLVARIRELTQTSPREA